jgi:hypothetical protein
MEIECMKLAQAVFRKQGYPDGRIVIRRECPEAFYVDVEKIGGSRVDTWPAVGPAPAWPKWLRAHYDDEFRRDGYEAGEWAEIAGGAYDVL